MTKEVQLRRGTTAQVFAFTGQVGELTPDTTLKRLVLHDGLTAGGKAIDAPRGWIDGLALARNGTNPNSDIDIAPGQARDSANATIMELTATLTKRLSAAWAAGSGNGGLFTGALTPATWYHVHLIEKDSDGSVDAGFDTDPSAANRPAGYSRWRRIGSIATDGSSNVGGFVQIGDTFLWSPPPLDISGTIPAGGGLYTLSVPPGVIVEAIVNVHTGGGTVYLSHPGVVDQAASASASPLFNIRNVTGDMKAGASNQFVFTDTSGRIRIHPDGAVNATSFGLVTLGWVDPRGRNA